MDFLTDSPCYFVLPAKKKLKMLYIRISVLFTPIVAIHAASTPVPLEVLHTCWAYFSRCTLTASYASSSSCFFSRGHADFSNVSPFNQFSWYFDLCWAGFMIFGHVELLDFINYIRFVTFFCFAIWNSSRLLAASSFVVKKNKKNFELVWWVLELSISVRSSFQHRS